MSEAILKALMQLFALISDIHDDTVITSREKDVVRKFLIRNLNNELSARYMHMFEEYLRLFNSQRIIKGSIQDRKRISLNAMRILAICEKINEELHQKQKIFVIVKLIDYISSGTEISETELDFLNTVSNAFNIPDNEFCNIRSFIIAAADICEKDKILIIDNDPKGRDEGIRHMCNSNLKGTIIFLNVSATNTWLMRYSGNEDLYLNGQNILEGETYVFDKGSSIRGSGIKTIYYSGLVSYLSEVSYQTGIYLNAVNVSFRFRKSENGVHNLNFDGKSGELAGIIGGSGAGKSTTLSILSGTLRPSEGKVTINGYDLYNGNDRKKLRGVIGFVPQDDLLIEELTVYQNLYYNAKMCLSNLPEDKLEVAVNRMLIEMDLYESRNLKVGNPLDKVISGGQRKRINIALELMREPTILFVDEPTSGLSSVDSEMVMNLLKDLTYKGKLVIINIHQPSSEIYKMFDKIMIIDRGGYQVFSGNPTEAIIYFRVQANLANPDEDQCSKCGNVDTEQILQIIESKVVNEQGKPTRIRKVSPGEWSKRFMALSAARAGNMKPGKQTLPENKYSIPGLLKQSVIFFKRDLLSKLADKQYIIISLTGPPLLALLLAYFTKTPAGADYTFMENDNIPAYLFMCVITSLFFGLMSSSEEIVSDRKILKRESFLNLSWFSYLNSKIMILFILSAIQSFSFVLTGNLILHIKGMTLTYWLVLFTISCSANILGLNLSSAFKSVITIYILIPFIIIPQLLFSGVLVKFDQLHINQHEFVPVIGDLMVARWSFEALATEQFKNNDYERLFFNYDVNESENSWYGMLADDLKTDLWICKRYLDSAGYENLVNRNFNKINIYSTRLSEISGIIIPMNLKALLNNSGFDISVEKEMIVFLDSVKAEFMSRMRHYTGRKNAVSDSIELKHGKMWLTDLRIENENNKLKAAVLSEDIIDQTFETEDKIIRKFKPGLMKAASPCGRAHFYAPVKRVGTHEISTYWFNIIVVWLVSLLFCLILYFRLPEKLVASLESLRLNKTD